MPVATDKDSHPLRQRRASQPLARGEAHRGACINTPAAGSTGQFVSGVPVSACAALPTAHRQNPAHRARPQEPSLRRLQRRRTALVRRSFAPRFPSRCPPGAICGALADIWPSVRRRRRSRRRDGSCGRARWGGCSPLLKLVNEDVISEVSNPVTVTSKSGSKPYPKPWGLSLFSGGSGPRRSAGAREQPAALQRSGTSADRGGTACCSEHPTLSGPRLHFAMAAPTGISG
jgi:hypothetical protein